MFLKLLRREAHHRIPAERRERALANPPPSQASALVGDGALRRSAVVRPAVDNHLHARDAGERPLEELVERGVVSAHDNEQLGIRKRSRWKRFEELLLVRRADTVRRHRIIQRFAVTQVAGLSFKAAPRADDVHLGDETSAKTMPPIIPDDRGDPETAI